MTLAFVVPVYNERDTLKPLAEGILENAAPHHARIYFVDDGSTDGSAEVLDALRENHPTVEVIRFQGNFGKSAALAAGFANAQGDIIFTMDSDLQDDPKEIPRFLEKLDEGYDVVCGWKAVRHDPLPKRIASRIYNRFVSWLFDLPLHDVNCGFKAFRPEVIPHLPLYGEMHRLIPVLAHQLHFRISEIPVKHHPRRYGHSKYGMERFTRGALDVLSLWFLVRHMYAPGRFFGKLGISEALLGTALIIIGLIAWMEEKVAPGLSLCIVGSAFVASGAVTLCLGFLAELMLRCYLAKDPRLYLVRTNPK